MTANKMLQYTLKCSPAFHLVKQMLNFNIFCDLNIKAFCFLLKNCQLLLSHWYALFNALVLTKLFLEKNDCIEDFCIKVCRIYIS